MYGDLDCPAHLVSERLFIFEPDKQKDSARLKRAKRQKEDLTLIKGTIMKKTYREMAEELGCKPSIVAGRIFRMRQDHSPYADLMPPAGHLSFEDVSKRNSRKKSDKINMKPPKDAGEFAPSPVDLKAPDNPPKTFLELGQFECSWALGSKDESSGSDMLCCAADVLNPSAREGDRRASHCAYHYARSIAQLPVGKGT